MARRRSGHRLVAGTGIGAVRDRFDRLLRIFEWPDRDAAEQAAKMVADGARFNLDPAWLPRAPLSPRRSEDATTKTVVEGQARYSNVRQCAVGVSEQVR